VEKRKKKKNKIFEKSILWLADKLHETKQSLITLIVFLITGSCATILFILLYDFFSFNIIDQIQQIPYVYPIGESIFLEIKARTTLGVLYLFSFSSIFIIPAPLEIMFYTLLSSTKHNITTLMAITTIGLIIGQHINYFSGQLFGSFTRGFIKKKTKKSIATKLNKYGGYAVFLMNLLLFPYPLANFIFGSVRYPYKRWAPASMAALALKIVIIYLIFTFF